MDIIKPDNIKRFAGLDRYEMRYLDSSSLGEFKRCPKAYFFRYVLGYTDKEEKIYFAFGRAYHKFREQIEVMWQEDPSVDFGSIIGSGMIAAMNVWGNTNDPPPKSRFFWLTRNRLTEAMIEGGKVWVNEKKAGRVKVLQTEQPFSVVLPNGVVRTGRFDNVVEHNGKEVWGRDYKTTTKEMQQWEKGLDPNDQFIGYTVAQRLLTGRKVKGQIIEVVLNHRPTKDGPKPIKIETRMVQYVDGQIDRWMEEQLYWKKLVDMCREEDLYPQNEKSCHYCQFHSVCKLMSENQQVLQLKSNFKIEVWDNTYED